MSNADLVIAATTRAFADRDLQAVDDHFGPTYVQHSTLAADGLDGLSTLIENLPEGFRYEPARVLADGDLVALHGTYHGFGPDPLVAFDIFRLEDGRIVEHWDALAPVVSETASGRSQTDGPTQVTDRDRTEANRALVAEFADKVLVGADYDNLTDYISTDTYAQHNPEADDGLAGFGAAAAAWAQEGKLLKYDAIRHVIADGDFVLTYATGEFGVPVIYADLFRVADGRIVEHWDVITPIPTELPHSNGVI